MAEVTEFDIREAVAVRAHADPAFRTTLLEDPKGAIEGMLRTPLPDDQEVVIVEDSADTVHFVIPPVPTEELSEEQLSVVAGGLMDPLVNTGGENICILGGGLVNTKLDINL